MQNEGLVDIEEKTGYSPFWLLCVIILLPCISVLSAYFMSRQALLFVYLMAGVTVFTALIKLRRDFADRFFPAVLYSVAASLLLSLTLLSENLSGFDIHLEYYLFQQVLQSGSWSPNIAVTYNTALSVTILPSVISLITSLGGVIIFKTVYPLLYAFVPVLLYRIYRRLLNPAAAFISVFVFLSFPTSYVEITQLGRQMIAEVLMVLLLWVLLSAPLRRSRSAAVLVVALTIGLVTSHYSLGLIYVLLIGFSYGFSRVSDLRSRRLRTASLASSELVAYSLVAAAAWYFFIAGGVVFQQVSIFTGFILQGMSDFFNPTSRQYPVLDALGVSQVNYGILHLINRGTQYLVVGFILIGVIVYLRKRPKSLVETALAAPIIASIVFLFAGVALPYFSATLNLTRIYDIALIFLAPLFYVGAMKLTSGMQRLVNLLTAKHIYIQIGKSLPVAIMFGYLLLSSGWVWAVTLDRPTSVVLDQTRMANSSDPQLQFDYYGFYTLSQDVAAVQWLKAYGVAGRPVCADSSSLVGVFRSYGGYVQSNQTSPIPYCDFANEYTYLSDGNSVTGVVGYTDKYGGTTLFTIPLGMVTQLSTENRIYSGGASIYEGYSS